MTKRDFVTAWLLAARSADPTFNHQLIEWHIEKAEYVWNELEKRYET